MAKSVRFTLSIASTLLVIGLLLGPMSAAQDRTAGSRTEAMSWLFPRADTEVERIRLLIEIRERIPNLFEDAAKYDINLLDLLQDQEKLQQLLLQQSGYREQMVARELVVLRFTPVAGQTVTSSRIPEQQIRQWREQLTRTAATFEGNDVIETKIKSRIAQALKALDGKTADGLFNGLVMQIDESKTPGLREQVRKAVTVEERAELLKRHLPERLDAQFKGAPHGLAEVASAADAVALYRKRGLADVEVRQMLGLYTALVDDAGNIALTPDAIPSRIELLSAHDLVFLSDKDGVTPRLVALQKELAGPPHSVPEGWAKPQTERVLKETRVYSKASEGFVETLSRSLLLKEVPPTIGIFRGCTGGDCSTQFSFPHPNAPGERVFFIYDDKGEDLKGYVTANVVVTEDGKRVLRLLTIAGPKLKASDTEVILHGFHSARDKLKVSAIGLPMQENLSGLINFPEVAGVLTQATAGKPTVATTYPDAEIRTGIIEKFESDNNIGEYDNVEKNPRTVLFQPATAKAGAQSAPVSWGTLDISKAPTRAELAEFALDLWFSKREDVFERTKALLPPTDQTKLDELAKLMANEKALPIEKLQASASKLSAELGISPETMKKKAYLFDLARLQSPDALSDVNRDATVRGVIRECKRQENWSSDLKLYLVAHSAEFQRHPIFIEFFEAQKLLHSQGKESLIFSLVGVLQKGPLADPIFLASLERVETHLVQARDADSYHGFDTDLHVLSVAVSGEGALSEKSSSVLLRAALDTSGSVPLYALRAAIGRAVSNAGFMEAISRAPSANAMNEPTITHILESIGRLNAPATERLDFLFSALERRVAAFDPLVEKVLVRELKGPNGERIRTRIESSILKGEESASGAAQAIWSAGQPLSSRDQLLLMKALVAKKTFFSMNSFARETELIDTPEMRKLFVELVKRVELSPNPGSDWTYTVRDLQRKNPNFIRTTEFKTMVLELIDSPNENAKKKGFDLAHHYLDEPSPMRDTVVKKALEYAFGYGFERSSAQSLLATVGVQDRSILLAIDAQLKEGKPDWRGEFESENHRTAKKLADLILHYETQRLGRPPTVADIPELELIKRMAKGKSVNLPLEPGASAPRNPFSNVVQCVIQRIGGKK